MQGDPATFLLFVTTAVTGLLAGASLDQSIKQLPARHTLGATTFSRYSQAADLANGVVLYAGLGIAVLVLNLAAAVMIHLQAPLSQAAVPVYGGAVAAVLHSIVTARAA